MRSFTIGPNDAGQRMDKFIAKAVPLLPKNLMYKYLRLKRIKRNGKRCEISTRLEEGDLVELYINDEFFDAAPDETFRFAGSMVPIIYEDENLLLVNKPEGLVVHGGRVRQPGHPHRPGAEVSGRKRGVPPRGGTLLCAGPLQPQSTATPPAWCSAPKTPPRCG